MKRSEKELRQAKFFSAINMITTNFFNGNDINLEHLEQVAKNGKVETSVTLLSRDDAFTVIRKEYLYEQKPVVLLQIEADIKSSLLIDMLHKNGYREAPLMGPDNLAMVKKFVDEKIANDTSVFKQYFRGKRLVYPTVWAMSRMDQAYFIKYAVPTGYGPIEATVETFISSLPSRKNVPDSFGRGSLMIVSRK